MLPIRLIEPVALGTAAATSAWASPRVGADRSPFDGAGVLPAVLDAGIDRNHAAFAGVQLIETDFSGSGNGDRVGRGTHCAGTIFGRDVDGQRIGMARGLTRALIGKVLADDGTGSSEMIFHGILWALQERAQVISMSLGVDAPGLVDDLVKQGWPVPAATSVALESYRGNLRMFDALMEMVEAQAELGSGTLLCAAAGNESMRGSAEAFEVAASIPAAAQGVVSVGAGQEGPQGWQIASFSNTFPQVSAPGVNILSARAGGGLTALNGASMATPCRKRRHALVAGQRQRCGPGQQHRHSGPLLASARADGFAPGVDAAGCGLGLIGAPEAQA